MKLFFFIILFGNFTQDFPFLIGNWSGKEIVTVRTKENGKYIFIKSTDSIEFIFNISEDGKVTGKIGNALLEDCYLKKNRNWLEEKLNLANDFVIRGKLNGKIFEKDPHQIKTISIPFNVVNFKTEGTLFQLDGFLNLNLYPMSDFSLRKLDN